MVKAGREKIIVRGILAILILFQVVCMAVIILNSRSSGDEWFSYGLANNAEDTPLFIDHNWIMQKTDETGWVNTEDIRSYFVVDEGEAFDYATVVNNQKRDVHPPLYYILIHTLCSFVPNDMSMLQGGIINLVFWTLLNLVLWKLGGLLFKTEWERLIPIFLLCISPITNLIVGYDRMYTMLCFFCITITYLQMRLRKDLQNRKLLLGIAAVTFFGCLTHYYFYMYLFAAFVVYAFEILILSREKIKTLLPCVGAHCAGGIAALLLYPKAISHMLFSYRGEQIRDGLFSNKAEGFTEYFHMVNSYSFGGHLLVVLGIAVVSVLVGVFTKKAKWETEKSYLWLIGGTTVLFYCIMAFISYEKVWSYITPLYVILVVGLSVLAVSMLWFLKGGLKTTVCMVLLFFMFGNALLDGVKTELEYQADRMEIEEALKTKEGRDCIFVYESWNNLYENRIKEILFFDEVLSVSLEELESTPLREALEKRDTQDELVVYLWERDNENVDGQIQYMEQELGKKATVLCHSNKFSVLSFD